MCLLSKLTLASFHWMDHRVCGLPIAFNMTIQSPVHTKEKLTTGKLDGLSRLGSYDGHSRTLTKEEKGV